jgi:hypothetical protein
LSREHRGVHVVFFFVFFGMEDLISLPRKRGKRYANLVKKVGQWLRNNRRASKGSF